MRNNNGFVGSVLEFAKNIALGSEEKLLREVGLKDNCGHYTEEAKEIVINKLIEENKDTLIDIANKIKEEQEKK